VSVASIPALERQRTLPLTKRPALEVFAVTDRSAQLTWRRLPEGTIAATVDGEVRLIGRGPGPGAAEITGLAPGADYRIELACGGRRLGHVEVRTQAALAGEPVLRIATISDLHLGETGFGALRRARHPQQPATQDPIPFRCAKAAVAEAVAWGAELLIVKGDITDAGRSCEWEMFDELLSGIDIKVLALPGNHDVLGRPDSLDGREELRRRGLYDRPVSRHDCRGFRIVTVDSTVDGHGWGRLEPRLDELCAEIDTPAPALVFTHHHFQNSRLPWFYPLGVARREAAPVLDRLTEVNADLLVSSGHSHRNRATTRGTALITEVSSTSDFPGVWAGYEVHADGVRQTVRRVSDPACIAWNDFTAGVVGGIWGRWSPGRLADRSRLHLWTRPRRKIETPYRRPESAAPPTAAPPTASPPTAVSPTASSPTAVSPTASPPTAVSPSG